MRVPIAYLAVVLIWSTTPLGIVWSSETVEPTMAVLLRMLIAWLIGWGIIIVCRIHLPWHKEALKLYSFSAIGIFGGMSLSYAAASYISSGLMSLIFGLSPILSGVLAQKLLAEDRFNHIKKLALVAALIGLVIVCYDKMTLKADAYIGIIFVLIAVFFFSLSGVMVKTINIKINPVATTVGALTFSTPLFLVMWLLLDGTLDYQQWSIRSVSAIIYLGLFGSLIGFISYFYVLQKLSASTVALVTMITPVLAITLGALLNDEVITDNLIVGAGFVVFGLTCYQWSSKVEYVVRYRFKKVNDTQT
ncbi:DMT family transporter [Thalassotalea marina]|uniref:Membrane protein n=1 Tax=Thalassotalea marina TaxID=1673741 RepID=A0A919BNZ7_9GAMM|nr:DMT family transporter [Thalassotalea marina]GHG01076.1 membrane protein [Thalassotalea marina]